jgi:hypothetical protein
VNSVIVSAPGPMPMNSSSAHPVEPRGTSRPKIAAVMPNVTAIPANSPIEPIRGGCRRSMRALIAR